MPFSSGSASARLTRRCCSTSESPTNRGARHVDLEVVAATRAIDDLDHPVGERTREQRLDLVGSHRVDGNARVQPPLPGRAPSVSDNDVMARVSYIVSLPERAARAIAAILGGSLHESFELALPRMVRQSRLYEATARNLLRVTIELVGGVEPARPTIHEYEPNPGRLAIRKGAGNVFELGSIFAFGFSPLWILAAAADVTHGSRAYLDTLVGELVNEGVLRVGSEFRSVDELLGALEGVSGTTARLIDIPPLETVALRQSLDDMRRDAASLPTPDELARVYQAIRAAAMREGTSMIDVSLGDRVRVLQLRAACRPAAPPRPVQGGPRATAGRGLRRVCAARLAPVRRGGGTALRRRAGIAHGERVSGSSASAAGRVANRIAVDAGHRLVRDAQPDRPGVPHSRLDGGARGRPVRAPRDRERRRDEPEHGASATRAARGGGARPPGGPRWRVRSRDRAPASRA